MKSVYPLHIIPLLLFSLFLFTGCSDDAQQENSSSYQWSEQFNVPIATTEVNQSNQEETGSPHAPDGQDNDHNSTSTDQTGNSANSSTATVPAATPLSLKLILDKTSLNKDENTTLKIMATYSDNTSSEVTGQVQWEIKPKDTVKITGNTLTALKDTPVTIQAKLGTITSEPVKLSVYWEVNGHKLPPEPDKAINNATLLGIDVNNNGVRDDVERWIYETYKDKHPIYIDIAMQAGRAYEKVLEAPEKAKEIREVVNAPIHCNWYYKAYAKYFNEPLLMKDEINPAVYNKYFNTKERKDVYWQYDTLLSGDSYDLPEIGLLKTYCDFNTSKYDKK